MQPDEQIQAVTDQFSRIPIFELVTAALAFFWLIITAVLIYHWVHYGRNPLIALISLGGYILLSLLLFGIIITHIL